VSADLAGIFIMLLTPLNEKRMQDEDNLRDLIKYYLDARIHGFTALGEVSERDRLTAKEKDDNIRVVMEEVKGKVPVVIGTSQEGTQLAVDASVRAEEAGASAVMVAPPKNAKLRDDAIFQHYAAISDAIGIPIVVQDEPETNHPYLSPVLIARISAEIAHARYLKLEDPPTPSKITKVRQLVGDKMRIFGAFYGRASLWELERGATGIMTSSATPEYLVGVWEALKNGEKEKASEIFFNTLPLINFYAEMSVAVRKEILTQRGIIRSGMMKMPAGELGEAERRELKEILTWTEDRLLAIGIPPHSLLRD
jgi:4-hydroxy-tetrahydrodipicolinate synthase